MPRSKLYPVKKEIRLDSELAKMLREASKITKKSGNEIIREALRQYIKRVLPEEGEVD